MNMDHVKRVASQMRLKPDQVQAVAGLLQDGATVPFIARYRKEMTGSLDEVAIAQIRDRCRQLEELDARRSTILKSLKENGHLTEALEGQVKTADSISALEDIYLPFRPKRRTRATMAREKGLEPLAKSILEQTGKDPDQMAAGFVDPENGVTSIDEALAGARDIIAEWVNEDQPAREKIRTLFRRQAHISSRVAMDMEAAGAKYRDYFSWQEPAATAPSHRILAMRRGEKEDILNLTIAPPEDKAIDILTALFVKSDSKDAGQVQLAVQDSYKRLMSRAMETEMRLETKTRADHQAIAIFAENLRQLLLAPPLGAKRVMGIDPGFRTGCKVACLNRQGKLLQHDTIFPHTGASAARQARQKIEQLCRKFNIEAIAVGNGTAGRETESFLKSIAGLDRIPVLLVNESGASVYSASEIARQEFPDLDLTVRGAVSIGRRLMDPLSELVKIDPKSIGVGQYQHDVDQAALKQGLDDVVISCVNAVGVDVNRGSSELFRYVSGLGPQLARNIVSYRDQNGSFQDREALKQVPRLGPKAFEQCAGFLRVYGGTNPLDASAVHPENYGLVKRMADDAGCSIVDLMRDGKLRAKIDLDRYVSDTAGLPTLKDIMQELAKPGRDPRQEFKTVEFAEGVNRIEDLQPGLKLPGIVTNVTAFGAFVDIGVHQDGLVHISELSDKFVKDPSRIVSVGQQVSVTVMGVDLDRKRIALSMKAEPGRKTERPTPKSGPRSKPTSRKSTRRPQAKRKPFNNPFAQVFKKQ